jgi:hypothetical protein
MSEDGPRMEISIQTATGCFYLKNFVFQDVYQGYSNITNVIVRLLPSDETLPLRTKEKIITTKEINFPEQFNDTTRNAILINSHFDSIYHSPGASDDGVSSCLFGLNFRFLYQLCLKLFVY